MRLEGWRLVLALGARTWNESRVMSMQTTRTVSAAMVGEVAAMACSADASTSAFARGIGL